MYSITEFFFNSNYPSLVISEEPTQSTEACELSTPDMTRHATFFDVAVMRCLLSSKWHSDGYIWALEYLGHRVTEITDHVLREHDTYLKFHRSVSVPTRLVELSLRRDAGVEADADADAEPPDTLVWHSQAVQPPSNQFVELINQIYNENDFASPKCALGSYYDHSRRKKYLANYHNRIRCVCMCFSFDSVRVEIS